MFQTGRRLVVAASVVVLFALAAPAAADPVVQRDFDDETWADGLIDLRSLDLVRTRLVTHGFAGGGLRVNIPDGGFRGFGPLDRLDPAPEEAWYRYHIRLLDWNAAFTGKLPGLAGLYSSSGRGCIPPSSSSPGWSARGLFGVPGTQGAPVGAVPIGTYLYHDDQAGTCGDLLWWSGAHLEQGRWHCVEGYARMNTPGANNGLFRGWLDGKHVFTQEGIAYRRDGETHIGVRQMWHNVYFGGSWPTPNPLSLMVDEVVVSTEGRVGCLAPFTDTAGSVHAGSLTELHARGMLFGCGYRQACPDRGLTRGETAALFVRILNLPAASKDYFSDDDGHIFENVINRLAEADITKGCGPGAFCPDRTLTRAEFAVMVVRALRLPASGQDAFTDDDGHWAEAEIDSLAGTGITRGCNPPANDRFCPNRTLTREEAASFFVRVLDAVKPLQPASVEPPPDYPPPGDPPPIPPDEQD